MVDEATDKLVADLRGLIETWERSAKASYQAALEQSEDKNVDNQFSRDYWVAAQEVEHILERYERRKESHWAEVERKREN